jgi:hypothetical protein
MLIDVSYFTSGPRHILNASLGTIPNPNAVEVNEALELYIACYQGQFLWLMLGALSDDVMDYLGEKSDESEVDVDMETLCSRLRESFADYVYYKILADGSEQATVTGLVRLKSANTQVGSPINRQVTVWNMMVERNRRFAEWASSGRCPYVGIKTSSKMLTKINNMNL